jgi:hypothetical protein
MNQSSALRQLETILDEAIENGDKNNPSGIALMQAMRLEPKPQNFVNFFALLYKAEEETRKFGDSLQNARSILAINKFQEQFILENSWGKKWEHFSNYIEDKNILSILDNLANIYHSKNPKPFLEEEFLVGLDKEFSSLLSEIVESDISRKLKSDIKCHIEDILSAIRNYLINGTEGIEKAAQSLIIDLEVENHKLSSEDRINPTIQKITGIVFSLVMFLKPSFWDIIGVVPDINEFWAPKLHELVEFRQKIEPQIDEDSTIKNICEKLSQAKETKLLTGASPKSLPPRKED